MIYVGFSRDINSIYIKKIVKFCIQRTLTFNIHISDIELLSGPRKFYITRRYWSDSQNFLNFHDKKDLVEVSGKKKWIMKWFAFINPISVLIKQLIESQMVLVA